MLIQHGNNVEVAFHLGLVPMIDQNRHLLILSAQIVAAHAGHNEVGSSVIPNMIRSVYRTLADLIPTVAASFAAPQHTHAAQHQNGHDHSELNGTQPDNKYVHPAYGQTVFGDHLICMEDGLSMKMLKRHLLTVHGMTPEEYRDKWGLPESYPMVASDYAKLRSVLALQSGLGLKQEDRSFKARKAR
jgi:predicted transcriptional regulator